MLVVVLVILIASSPIEHEDDDDENDPQSGVAEGLPAVAGRGPDGKRLPEAKDGHDHFGPYAGRQKMTARFVQASVRWLSIFSLALTSFGQSLEGIAKVDPSLRSHGAASWDRAGGNNDAIRGFAPGETHVMLDTAAPGCIRHIWMTVSRFPSHDTYLRDLVVRMYWDGSAAPSVEVPVGDFFGLGHGKPYAFESVPVAVGENPAAMNCYWPMPFRKQARVERWYWRFPAARWGCSQLNSRGNRRLICRAGAQKYQNMLPTYEFLPGL